MASRPVKRKDGKPTRAERSEENKRLAKTVREMLAESHRVEEPKTKRPVSDDDIETVLRGVAEGGTVRRICRQLGVAESSVRIRLVDDAALLARYSHARRLSAYAMIEKNQEEAEVLVSMDPSAEGANVAVQIAKHVENTRRWIAGKYHQTEFGDKVTQVHEGNPDRPVVTKDVTEMSAQEMLEEFHQRLRERRTK